MSRALIVLLIALLGVVAIVADRMIVRLPQKILEIDVALPAPSLQIDPAPVSMPAIKPVLVDPLSVNCQALASSVEKVAGEVWGIEAPTARLLAQLHQESRCEPGAISIKDARGIAQFIGPTARLMAARYPELAPADPTSEKWAIRAQAYLMRDLLAHYDAAPTSCDQWALALGGYNGGERALDNENAQTGHSYEWAKVEPKRARSLPAWRENRDYVRRVLRQIEPQLVRAGYGLGVELCV
ncbi:lytic transglycosylase domain-containing protein [bacterium]|nr:lytic transglycosylase domain-containing protein [bacterium]